MWLADLKLEWHGKLPVLPFVIDSGGRYAITHCCCNYPTLPPQQTEALRKQWENTRTTFRRDWSQKFANWPVENGKAWPGHHIHDLGHGGAPKDPNNILPTPPDIHGIFSDEYPVCYGGSGRWSMVGPDLPYRD